ncbi:MAG: S41 family peptidase [Candidatus Brocadiia bacterium]
MRHKKLLTVLLLLIISVTLYAVYPVRGSLVSSPAFAADASNGAGAPKEDPVDKQLEKLRSIYKLIKECYVVEPDANKLFESAVKGLVGGLDPYSEYFTAEEYNDFMVATKGEFGGVGMEVSVEDGILTVITPLEDTPAFRAGIMAGDRILEIDGVSTEGMTTSDSIRKVRGKPGTQVLLVVLHKGAVNTDKITVTREIIKLKSVKGTKMVDEKHKIGYIRLTQFQEDTLYDLDVNIDKLEAQGMKGLIIDLRFNPGGLLEAACRISNRFIKEGLPIVSTRGRKAEEVSIITAEKEDSLLTELPLAIIVNGASASASEVFSGCMQDHKRAAIVGVRSYGKGSVQTIFPIEKNGPAVKMTIARYYTPSGRSVDKSFDKKNYGVLPDYIVEMTTEQETDLIKSRLKERVIIPPNPKDDKDKKEPAMDEDDDDESDDFEDIQLDKAIEVLVSQQKAAAGK